MNARMLCASACLAGLLAAGVGFAQDSTNYFTDADFAAEPANNVDWVWNARHLKVTYLADKGHLAPGCISMQGTGVNDTAPRLTWHYFLDYIDNYQMAGRYLSASFWLKNGRPKGKSYLRVVVQASQNPYVRGSGWTEWKDLVYKTYPANNIFKGFDTTWVEGKITKIPIIDTINLMQMFFEFQTEDDSSIILLDDVKLWLEPASSVHSQAARAVGPQAISFLGNRAILAQPAPYRLSVLDARGAVVSVRSGYGRTLDLATPGLARGCYVLRLATPTGAASSSLLIDR